MLPLSAAVLVSGLLLSPLRSPPITSALVASAPRARLPLAALDYKDPDVAEEFALIQGMDFTEVEDELAVSGIMAPSTMNDMDVRLMLVEMRLRKAGKLGSQKKKAAPRPKSFANDFEKALFEKPAFKELYEKYQKLRNTNALNLAAEYLNNPRQAKERYGGTPYYESTLAEIDEALNAKVEQVVKSPRLLFSGFPANMGEAGVRMTLQTFGPLADLSIEESDDGLTLSGRAEFEEIDAAKAAIEKYDGVDMGLGTTLELQAL